MFDKKKQEKTRGFEVVKGVNAEEIKMPLSKTSKSAGYDFFAPERIKINAGGTSDIIMTNIKAYMLDDEVLELHIRSSLGMKKGIMLSNITGIIDADYYENKENDGNIGFKLTNLSDNLVVIEKGDAFMQGIFKKYLVADNCNSDDERSGGIGSTDK